MFTKSSAYAIKTTNKI